MRRGLTVGLVLVFVAPALADSKPKYHTHKDAVAGYTVIFPGKPSESSKSVAGSGGNLDIETQRVEFNGVVYSVTFTEYPDPLGDVQTDKILDGVRDGMKGPDGKATTDEKINLDSVTGRDLRIEAAKKEAFGEKRNVVRVKVFLSKRRLYQVMASGSADRLNGKDVDDFLDSFKWYK